MIRSLAGGGLLLALVPCLAACDIPGQPNGKSKDEDGVNRPPPLTPTPRAASALPGTPMDQRVAIIGLLNKRNGLTRDLTMKPGQALRAGDAIVRLRACETAAPWENHPETGAFVQLDVRSTKDNKWRRVFSGWLFKERPDRNVVQHPVYDIWVKNCAMSWPETGPQTVGSSARKVPSGASGARASAVSAPGPDENSAPASSSATPDTAPESTDE